MDIAKSSPILFFEFYTKSKFGCKKIKTSFENKIKDFFFWLKSKLLLVIWLLELHKCICIESTGTGPPVYKNRSYYIIFFKSIHGMKWEASWTGM